MSDDLAALKLQLAWGADEAIGEVPMDRFVQARPASPVSPMAVSRQPAARPQRQAITAPRAAPEAATLEALFAEIESFEGCRLRDTATRTVRASGDPAARVVLIGEAPDADDDRSGIAFSGRSGALLDRILAPSGIDRRSLLLTTMLPWRPPGGRPATEAEIQTCLPFVHRLLAITRPDRLVLAGAATVKALTGRMDSVRRLRGNWLEVAIPQVETTISALPLPALDQWLGSPSMKHRLWLDLISLQKAATTT